MPYIGRGSDFGVRSRFIYTATANQTTFSGNDDAGITLAYTDTLYMDVYQNGVLLVPATDYAASTGTSVVLVQGASVDDTLELLVHDIFSVADSVSKKDGGAFSGNLSATDITATATLNAQGDTAAGDNAAIGYTAAEGLILTGQGSTNDVTIKNDADADVIEIPTGTVNVTMAGNLTAAGTLASPSVISSSVGLSHIGEFTANTALAGNSAAIIQLQDCFTSEFSVYRILGSIGGGHDSEDDSEFRFLSSGTTSIDSNYYWVITGLDDAGTTNASEGANTSEGRWNKNCATTISHKIDMHIYFGGGSGHIAFLGRTSYHDQGGDRGFIDFGGRCEAANSATGIEFFVDDGGNMAVTNFTVYGYRTTQQAASKMVGSYTTA